MAILRDQKTAAWSMFYGVFALCAVLLICTATAEARVMHQQQIEKSLSADGVSLLAVKAVSGDVRISSWEQPEVLVKAFKKVRAGSSEKAQEYSDKIEIIIERIDDRIEVTTKQSLLRSFLAQTSISVEYDIFVPENIDLDIECVDGSVYVAGNRGTERISIIDGNIELKNIVGSVSAKTINGNIHVEALFDAESSFSAMSGFINIHIGDDFSVPISARAVSGYINVTVPEGFPANVDASTLSGRASCDFPFDGLVKDRSLRGAIFGGGPLLKLRAIDGNVAIRAPEGWIEPLREPEQEHIRIKREEPPEELELNHVEVVKTLDSPIIDGRLNDKCWKSAGKIEGFVWADGVEKPHEPTEAYLLWDDRNFYVGIKCYESHMDTVRISNTEADKEAWQDDVMQIFIDTTPETRRDYYHIAVNPIGTVFDQEISRADVVNRTIQESRLGIKWDSGGLIDTDMRSDSWTIEAGIPFSVLKTDPKEGDVWRFNLYRVEQRRGEHTYWSPTFAKAEWPHVPDSFGEVAFITVRLVAKTPEEKPVPSEAALTIADIAIEGNDEISQDEILDALGLKPGDLADVELLSQAKLHLESLGWFEHVSMDLIENDKGVDLIVKVIEKEIISPSEVQIRGSVLFTAEQLMEYFNFGTLRTTIEDVGTKCKLIEQLYTARGYEMIAVSHSIVSNVLIIDVDEGCIDKIEIRGNRKVRTKEIIESLDLDPGMSYKRDEIDKAVYTMQARLPYFRKVTWEPGRSDDGLNVVYIDVKEDDLVKGKLDGESGFDRVHGFQLGLKSELKSTYGMAKGYCEFSYGFSSKIWNYQFGMEKSWFRGHESTIGIDVHRLTDTNDRELVSNAEHFIAEAILGEAWRDFYQREGYELKFGQKFNLFNRFDLKYRDDEYTSLEKSNDWSLLNRSYDDDDWFEEFRWAGSRSREIYRLDEDEKYKPENPPIKEGRMRSLIAEYTIDTRNSKKNPTSGWLNTFSAEYAGRKLSGDFDFNRYQMNIRRYNRLSGNQFVTFRVKAGKTDRALSEDHPRKFRLGGIGTLRGYRFKAFSGDKMVLINAEYWITTHWPPGLGLVFFVDSGYAWSYDEEMSMDDMKTDLGIGFQLGGLRVNLASPVGERENPTVLSVRIARMF